MTDRGAERRRLLTGAGILGFGFGGLVDVVLFHLVLQHHHLLSGYVNPTDPTGFRRNVMYDGLFLLLMVTVMIVGFLVVWWTLNDARQSHSALGFVGSFLVGIGAFNLFDGIVNHYVLGLHDVVHETGALNPHWIGASLILLAVGVGLLYRDRPVEIRRVGD